MRYTGYDLDGHPVVVGIGSGDFRGTKITISRFTVLEVLGEVYPELEADVGSLRICQ